MPNIGFRPLSYHTAHKKLHCSLELRRCVHFRHHTIFPGIRRDFRATKRTLSAVPEAQPMPEALSAITNHCTVMFYGPFRGLTKSLLCDTRSEKDITKAHSRRRQRRRLRTLAMMFHHFLLFGFLTTALTFEPCRDGTGRDRSMWWCACGVCFRPVGCN